MKVGNLGGLGLFYFYQAAPRRLVELNRAGSAIEAEISRVYRPVLGVVSVPEVAPNPPSGRADIHNQTTEPESSRGKGTAVASTNSHNRSS